MTDSVETIHCSNCKRDILSTNFVIHDIHCQRNIYLCTKCNEPVNLNKRAEHDEANHVLVYCNSCHTQVEKCLLSKHLENTCSQRKVKCQICDIEIGICDIVEHENYCGARTEKCSECGEFVMLKYKQLHIDSNHTFIKLSDEPGPSPSWQNGRRTLGNFLPDLQSGLYHGNTSHQKKRLGRSEYGKRRSKISSEFSEKEEKTRELTIPNEKQKHSHQRNADSSSSSHSHDYKRADREIRSSGTLENSVSNVLDNCSEINSVGLNKEWNTNKSNGKEYSRRIGDASPMPKYNEIFRKNEERVDITNRENNTDEDSSLALAIQLSEQLNGDFHLNKDKLVAQAIEENAVVLSQFSLFDKKNVSSDKNLSKNFYTGKKQSKSSFHYRNDSYDDDDDDDDDFLLYAKTPGREVDDTRLPCQFCNSLYPSYTLMTHQRQCELNGDLNIFGKTKYQRKNSSPSNDKEEVIACGICDRLIPVSRYDSHQLLIHSSSSKK